MTILIIFLWWLSAFGALVMYVKIKYKAVYLGETVAFILCSVLGPLVWVAILIQIIEDIDFWDKKIF